MERDEEKTYPSGLALLLLFLIALCLWLTSCRAGYNSPRHKGYITTPSLYLIGEMTSLELPGSYSIESNRKPKDAKTDYVMPQYKRETNYYK